MRESVEKSVGYGLGCAVVCGLGLAATAVVALLALAFPITLSLVLGTIAVLAFIEWRRRRARTSTDAPDAGPTAGDERD